MATHTAVVEARGVRRRGQLYTAAAATAWSTAGVLQRGLSVDTATQVAGRAVFAAVALFLFVAVSERGGTIAAFRRMGRAELAVAVLTAFASGAFIVALNYTTVANVLFMMAVSPIAAALIAWVGLRERISRRTLAAMVVALAGVTVMVGGAAGGGIGIWLSLAMTVIFALAVVITRHRRDISMAPAICLSQVVVVVCVAPFAEIGSVGAHDLMLMIVLGFGQMGLGLAFLTMGARLIPAAEVALVSLLEVVLGPLWVWLAYQERPSTATLLGGAVVVAAVVLQAGAEPGRPPGGGPRTGGRRLAADSRQGYAAKR